MLQLSDESVVVCDTWSASDSTDATDSMVGLDGWNDFPRLVGVEIPERPAEYRWISFVPNSVANEWKYTP